MLTREEFAELVAQSSDRNFYKENDPDETDKQKIARALKIIPKTLYNTFLCERMLFCSFVKDKMESLPIIKDGIKKTHSVLCGVHFILKLLRSCEKEFDSIYQKNEPHCESTSSAIMSINYNDAGIWHPEHINILSHILQTPNYFKIMIHGSPGTGKSSIIKVIEDSSSILRNCDTCFEYINSIQHIPNKNSIDKNVVYVIEDIDLLVATNRDGSTQDKTTVKILLDFLDNVNKVIITTNKTTSLDDAIYRSGRIDSSYEVGNISKKDLPTLVRQKLIHKDYNLELEDLDNADNIIKEIVSLCKPISKNKYRPSDVEVVIRQYVLDSIKLIKKQSVLTKDRLLNRDIIVPEKTIHSKIVSQIDNACVKVYDIRNFLHTFIDEKEDKKNSLNLTKYRSGFFNSD